MKRLPIIFASFAITVLTVAPLRADDPFPPSVKSLGQPKYMRITWGPMLGYDFDKEHVTGRAFVDFQAQGMLPQFGINYLGSEVSFGFSDRDFESAFGVFLRLPYVRGGIEYNFLDDNVTGIVGAQFGLRRGGLFSVGDEIRFDYRWQRDEIMLGFVLHAPWSYRMTRPRDKHVDLPGGKIPQSKDILTTTAIPAELTRSMDRIDHCIRWMDALLTPRFAAGDDFVESAKPYRDHVAMAGHTFLDEDSTYHAELTRAFTLASGGDGVIGTELAFEAERLIFDAIVVPYNRLFGQNKKPYNTAGFGESAMKEFTDYVNHHPNFAGLTDIETREQRELVLVVFRNTIGSIDHVTRIARDRWKQKLLIWLRQSRLVWLPLNYGLRPEQYETQEGYDKVIASVLDEPFTNNNAIRYLINDQFHPELKRTVRETEKYHVLMIHDYKGKGSDGKPDSLGWDLIYDGYLPAFANAVEKINRGERNVLPQYMLLLDEYFYTANKAREVVTYLERLYKPKDLKFDYPPVATKLEDAHTRLIAAIEASPVFGRLKEDELEDLFKVNVTITHAFDPTFWADATMHDHRKLAFRDVFDDDPSSGVGIVTGEGVGELYTNPDWEDRALRIRGPMLVQLRDTARRLLIRQGFKTDEIPFYLRSGEADDGTALTDLGAPGTRMVAAANDTGYGRKRATILKAAMYNLAQPGSMMLTLDSIWQSDFWGGMFIAAALRGANMFPFAPSPSNAPSNAAPTLYLIHRNLGTIMRARTYFRREITAARGELRVGVYHPDYAVDDLERRLVSFIEGTRKYPFIKRYFPFDESVTDLLHVAYTGETVEPKIKRNPFATPEPEKHWAPKLHLKCQFFVTKEGREIFCNPTWASSFARYLEIRRSELSGENTTGITPSYLSDGITEARVGSALSTVESGRSNARSVYLMTLGSHNMDRRGMLLDGEILVAVSGYDALICLPDMAFFMGCADWPEDAEAFSTIFPDSTPNFLRRFYLWATDLF